MVVNVTTQISSTDYLTGITKKQQRDKQFHSLISNLPAPKYLINKAKKL